MFSFVSRCNEWYVAKMANVELNITEQLKMNIKVDAEIRTPSLNHTFSHTLTLTLTFALDLTLTREMASIIGSKSGVPGSYSSLTICKHLKKEKKYSFFSGELSNSYLTLKNF